MNDIRKAIRKPLVTPVLAVLERFNLSPNAVSLLGFLLTVAGAVAVALGHLYIAGALVLVGGFCDMLDGEIARRQNRVTVFGGVLDSTLDRIMEGFLLVGVAALFLFNGEKSFAFSLLGSDYAVLLVIVTLVGSFLVSYLRSRAEAAGIECQVGLFTRTERVLLLVLGLFLEQLVLALAVIAILSYISVAQRLYHVWRTAGK